MQSMANLFFGLSWVILAGFALLCLWAGWHLMQKKQELPKVFYLALNATHIAYIAALTAGFLSGGGNLGMRFVIEYTLLYIGGGIVYSRGLIQGGFWWKVLRDPPKVVQGMVMANGWCFAAALGYLARGS
jgi:predicted membrane channel-forming protein YqfA (hemolysin III family)